MADDQDRPKPDFAAGVPFASIPEGGIHAGVVDDEPVLLTRFGDDIRAYGGKCTHLGAPLERGLVSDGAIRCPWHHACFDLRSGRATAAPAFDALPTWVVERRGEHVFVSKESDLTATPPPNIQGHSQAGLVILGGGAAGYAAAHELRALGFEEPVTMVSADPAAPYDRTLLTKDYLDGKVNKDRLSIARTTLDELGVTFLAGTTADSIDRAAKQLHLSNGHTLPYTKLLLATGAEPNRLDVPGADLPHVHLLRSLADCEAILAALQPGRRVVVIGSSFIGLEAAASIRSRGFDVTVVTPDEAPMAKILGLDMAGAILAVHAAEGVVVRTEQKVAFISSHSVHLADGTSLPADLVVVGIGVTPRVAVAEAAGLTVDKGVVVDHFLATSDPDIYAAGDIARWPDPHSGQRIRVEHWVVAERQGQVAARNMVGGAEPYTVIPFFWSKHFDFSFRYVGHAESWDDIVVEGDLAAKQAIVRYRKDGRELAVATVERDLEALTIERAMQEQIHT